VYVTVTDSHQTFIGWRRMAVAREVVLATEEWWRKQEWQHLVKVKAVGYL
jgi:hypothetical protein